MLFDLKGKRKRMIQVIYATLAVLMGGGLIFFGIGGEVSGGLFDAFTDQSGARVGDQIEEAENLEEQLAAEPGDEQLLTRLIRARYTAGNALYEFDDAGQQRLTPEAREQFELAVDAWDRYEQAAPARIDPNIAQLVANAYFALAQGATDGNMARAMSAAAADAQAHFAQARPSLGSLSSLALYYYFGNQFDRGDRAAQRAIEQADEGTEADQVRQEMRSYRDQAREFQDELDAFNEMTPDEGTGLQSPGFGG